MRIHFLILTLAGSAVAQQGLVVPATYSTSEGPSVAGIAGFTSARRQQIIVDAAHLQQMVNKQVTGLWFRRDGRFTAALSGGQAQLTVQLGVSPLAAASSSPILSQNLATSTATVFQGILNLPNSPPLTSAPGWASPDAVEIRFSTAYLYGGGNLVIDLDGFPVAGQESSFWPIDATSEGLGGGAQVVGTACGAYSAGDARTASVGLAELIPGKTVRFVARGNPGNPAYLLLGLTTLSTPLDLGALGSPGCWLYVNSFASLSTVFAPPEIGAEFGGLANILVHLPSNAVLLGARFVVQWVDFGPPLTTSEALVCSLSSSLPTLGMAMVTAPRGAPGGRVNVVAAPVIRFDYQ